MTVRPLQASDRWEWLRMRYALWPEVSKDDLARGLEDPLAPAVVFVSPREQGGLQGFVEVAIRNRAEGCETDRVAFIEGWYVDADRRRRGIGRALIAAAEDWGRAQGCTEIASDADLTNTLSHRAHERLGFAEQQRLVCFRKSLERRT